MTDISRMPGPECTDCVIEPAQAEDLAAIVDVMRPWNMHHIPSPEMPPLDLSCFFVARAGGRVIAWHKDVFGYREVGALPKLCSFGDDAIGAWTTLELDLIACFKARNAPSAE